ncbi:MAG: YraN family protein [Bacteroidetes bacterium]|nr:MAG: YraN family protein [Bacteroidota bacterium]
MARHHEIGRKGEELAQAYLRRKGWTILETNWRYQRAEVDIIAKDGPVLVFVEVKTRSSAAFGQPEEFITPYKEQLLTDAAHAYMEHIGHEWEIRFDFVSILLHPDGRYRLRHFPDAFFPGLEG